MFTQTISDKPSRQRHGDGFTLEHDSQLNSRIRIVLLQLTVHILQMFDQTYKSVREFQGN